MATVVTEAMAEAVVVIIRVDTTRADMRSVWFTSAIYVYTLGEHEEFRWKS